MKFRIIMVDDYRPDKVIERYPCLKQFGFDDGYITINSLDELMTLTEKLTEDIIIKSYVLEPEIEIYDGYRE